MKTTNYRALVPTSLILAAMGLAPLGSCDKTATFFPDIRRFEGLQVVSGYPGRKVNGQWERQCGVGPVDGLITNVMMRGGRFTDDDVEQDLSIQPGDVIEGRTVNGGLVDDINLSNPGNFGFDINCIDPVGGAVTSECQGAVPSAQLETTEWVGRNDNRDDGHNIMILIDQSGSVGGLVDRNDNNRENKFSEIDEIADFGAVRSDPHNLRLASVRRFIRLLNRNDRVGVLAFGEEATEDAVPCSEAGGLGINGALDACFGKANLDIWLSSNGIDKLSGNAQGRSNMWDRVNLAYTYLENLDDRRRSNHIIVVSDGPDTCSGENLADCQAECSTVDAQDILARVRQQNTPNAVQIALHFVQFEALGYPGRDARQVELACESGGHYQYVNSINFPREQAPPMQAALDTALTNLRFTLGGHWAFAAAVPAYQRNGPVETGTPPGKMYATSGAITVRASSNMLATDRPFPYGLGVGLDASEAPQWDRRPTFRKPCGGPTDCNAAADAESACTIICSEETMICANGAVGVSRNDTARCTTAGGLDGFCCNDQCQTSGSVCASCP